MSDQKPRVYYIGLVIHKHDGRGNSFTDFRKNPDFLKENRFYCAYVGDVLNPLDKSHSYPEHSTAIDAHPDLGLEHLAGELVHTNHDDLRFQVNSSLVSAPECIVVHDRLLYSLECVQPVSLAVLWKLAEYIDKALLSRHD